MRLLKYGFLATLGFLSVAPWTLWGWTRWSVPAGPVYRGNYNSIQFNVDGTVRAGLLNRNGNMIITADSDPQAALSAALAEWNSVPSTSARFQPLMVTPSVAVSGDGVSVFVFADTDTVRSVVGSALAITRVVTRAGGGVVDTDIYFNPAVTFSTTLYVGTVDLQATATHELGHALGADHSNLFTSTMFPYVFDERTLARSLSDDDVAFVSTVYPALNPAPTGNIGGKITFDTGAAVRGAAVVAADTSRGILVSTLSHLDGSYQIQGLSPGSYIVYTEPIGNMLQPSSVGLSNTFTDVEWAPAIYGGAASPVPVSVTDGGGTAVDITVSSQPPGLVYDFSLFFAGSFYSLFDLMPSGQAVDVGLSAYGVSESLTVEDILILTPGISVRPDSLFVIPSYSPDDIGIVMFTIDVAARNDLGYAFLGIRQGSEIAMATPVKVVPAGPFFAPSDVYNAAGGTSIAVAPGEVASIYGVGMGPTDGIVGAVDDGHLPFALGGVKVHVNDMEAPLFYVSSEQINFQVPYEVDGRSTATVTVSMDGFPDQRVTLPVAATAPAVFPHGYDWAILNSDYSLNNADNPARAGGVVMVYCSGLGKVSPQVPTGSVAPLTTLSTFEGVTATIAGVPATVYFAGLAPGFVGLAQLNVMIPEGTTPGYQALLLRVRGQSSGAWADIAVQ